MKDVSDMRVRDRRKPVFGNLGILYENLRGDEN